MNIAAAVPKRRDAFVGNNLSEALVALDDAHQAATNFATRGDHLYIPGEEPNRLRRNELRDACGLTVFRLRRCAALMATDVSPRVEVEALADAVASMPGARSYADAVLRLGPIRDANLAAREAVGAALRELYGTSNKLAGPA